MGEEWKESTNRPPEPDGSHDQQGKADRRDLHRRIFLTVLIVGGGIVVMVLPVAFLFHDPERFAGLAASGIVMAVAVHLILNARRRRLEAEARARELEADGDGEPDTDAG